MSTAAPASAAPRRMPVDVDPGAGVHALSGLLGKQHLGLGEQGAREHHLLLVPAREGGDRGARGRGLDRLAVDLVTRGRGDRRLAEHSPARDPAERLHHDVVSDTQLGGRFPRRGGRTGRTRRQRARRPRCCRAAPSCRGHASRRWHSRGPASARMTSAWPLPCTPARPTISPARTVRSMSANWRPRNPWTTSTSAASAAGPVLAGNTVSSARPTTSSMIVGLADVLGLERAAHVRRRGAR